MKNRTEFTNEEAIKTAIGAASTPKMRINVRQDMLGFLRSSAQAYIYAISAVAKATINQNEAGNGIIREESIRYLRNLAILIEDKIKEIENEPPPTN